MAKSGQLRRVSSPSLKLEGVYRSRGDSVRGAIQALPELSP